MSALFQIAKRELLYELADDRQKRFGSFPAFPLLWNVMWYRFKMLVYVMGESTPNHFNREF
jgi:hypothetical protein